MTHCLQVFRIITFKRNVLIIFFTDEREKLFDEVETEWAKKESRSLLRAQQTVNKLNVLSNSDSESEDESEECITKGRNMALNAFYRIARNTMSMWFKTTEPLAQEVISKSKPFLLILIINIFIYR